MEPEEANSRAECEAVRRWDIVRVEKAVNGFIVKVGCKTFVALSWGEVATELSLYWDDPAKAQRKYCG